MAEEEASYPCLRLRCHCAAQASCLRRNGDEARLLAKMVNTLCLLHVRDRVSVAVHRPRTRQPSSSCFSLNRRGGRGALCARDQNMPLKRDQEAAQVDCRGEKETKSFSFLSFSHQENSGKKYSHEQPFPFPCGEA